MFIGVVHLLPLPGAPRASPGLECVLERALADAHTLARGGADAVIVENLGDAPFTSGSVEPYTVAALSRIAIAVVEAGIPVGVNVLRNDAMAALSVAAASDAAFIRVNVHTGVMVSDQGLLTGAARATLLERNRLGATVAIAADVHVKHAAPLGAGRIEDAAHDTWHRGHADVLIVSGAGTGQPTDSDDVDRVRRSVPEATIWIGSGLTPASPLAPQADGAVVGTWLHRDADLTLPLDEERVASMRRLLR